MEGGSSASPAALASSLPIAPSRHVARDYPMMSYVGRESGKASSLVRVENVKSGVQLLWPEFAILHQALPLAVKRTSDRPISPTRY
ncbi:hypothetical protein T4D_1524 [Trichinella pseudospiralis]|uniref:Uncharacterized protein n=1 Tax=Trichinella pseudospiralis TaxID=6337 RepID=A0A0V1FYV9_TRIPS|nr:hypothetical protein T4D_1524 [Trichinella pseudospiralis]